MAGKLIVIIFIFFTACIAESRQEPSIPINEGPEEELFLDQFVHGCETTIYDNSDTLRRYHVNQQSEEAPFDFGWFIFEVHLYKDSSAAMAAYTWRNTPRGEGDKAPEYRLRYQKRIYCFSTACAFADDLINVYHSFLDLIDHTQIGSEDCLAIECGGRHMPCDIDPKFRCY